MWSPLNVWLKQWSFVAGFSLSLINKEPKCVIDNRGDIAALSKRAAEVTEMPMMHELEAELFEEILTS